MYIGDFHIHSKYSRAVSKNMNVEELDAWARKKGIAVMGTGDFTHPDWFAELRQKLEPAEEGLFILKNGGGPASSHQTAGGRASPMDGETRFLLTVEISCIYSKGNKVRKVHHIVFAPSFEAVEKINTQLSWIGNIRSDGRPILGLDSKQLAKIVFDADEQCLLVPAHAWTPWFSIFGSKSGFDSIEECFEEYTPRILAIETGLSSDPSMNWRVSALDNVALISNSDSHSAPKIGRECNVFEGEMSYPAIAEAIKFAAPKRAGEKVSKRAQLLYTVEFFPEEGKYHYDGHRLCGVSMPPQERKAAGNDRCPRCGQPLTIGVMSRVEDLADRPVKFKPEGAPDFKSLVPLEEIIAGALGIGVGTKGEQEVYEKLLARFGNDFAVLLDAAVEEIAEASSAVIAEGVKRVREGKLHIAPGYDGEFGKVKIFTEEERKAFAEGASADTPQGSLF